MAEPFALQVVIPFSQPLSATDADLDAACARCYRPLLEAIGARSGARITLHFAGRLLDYCARHQEGLLMRVEDLAKANQVEVLGGLFNGGLVPLLSEADIRGQIEMMAEFWESYLGWTPAGYWLPECAWGVEVPRLLQDTGLEYGFLAAAQVDAGDRPHRGLGVLERGDQHTAVFAIDEGLSAALPAAGVDEWVEALLDHAGARSAAPGHVTTVTVRAEALGLDPRSHEWCMDGGWLDRWLEAIGGGRPEISPTLPADAFLSARPAVSWALLPGCGPIAAADGIGAGGVDWPDFPRCFVEVRTLYRRMLQVSDKLAEAIATMEEEEMEDEWSDTLATAQRLVFAAQSPDAYWRGLRPGCTDPTIRDATMQQIIRSANMLDGLVQGDEDWIATEEEDRDRDLIEEVLVSTARLMAWLVPAEGGRVRTLESRVAQRNVIDVGVRHQVAYPEATSGAVPMTDDPTLVDSLPRGAGNAAAPDHIDTTGRSGITTLVFEAGTSPEELDSGSAVSLGAMPWQLVENQIDAEGDCSYRMRLTSETELAGTSERKLTVVKSLRVPIDEALIEISHRAQLEGGPEVVVATEIPIRLKHSATALTVNGEARSIPTEPIELFDAEIVTVACEGERVTIRLSGAADVWCLPVRTLLRTHEGCQRKDQGLVFVPLLTVENEAELTIAVDLGPGNGSS